MSEESPPSEKGPRIEDDDRLDPLEEMLRLATLPLKELQDKIRSLEDAQDMLRMCRD